jgi:hypothetical protein
MTVFRRGAVFLNCLICGQRDFEIVRNNRLRGKVLRYKRCGFMVEDSGYFDLMPKGTPVPVNEHALFMVKKRSMSRWRVIE